ncbi:putative dsRNA-binding protein [Methanoregula sp.]|uniref:ribonuclease III family protein n=1 Tax=Methanoregula sp. TaxID=2052170 RepID=UPI002604A32A|nr:putative dsRNA-binding protein [Methanoregula sp.]MDD5143399.1 putative dsRNA-binding protein [Methanoregula sp.]
MTGHSCMPLIELLRAPRPDLGRAITTFVSCFNTAYGDPAKDHWDIPVAEWERYEFLGDRVLNLIVAQALFTRRNAALSEGEMTRAISGIVSNHALDAIVRQQVDMTVFSRLIPPAIAGQNTYGERVTGGAFEAFIGALYCEIGLDEVTFFVNGLLKEPIDNASPEENAIGMLQEYFQKRFRTVPTYRETKREGPDHRPVFTFEVLFNNQVLGVGSGESIQKAEREAARAACRKLGITLPDPVATQGQ